MVKHNDSIYKTAMFVAVLSAIEKFLGFLYKVLLSRTIGSEGIGVYQIAFSVFAVLITATASGIPISVSRLITKNRALGKSGGDGTVSAGIFLSLIITLPVLAAILIARGRLSFLFSDERCLSIFMIMAPGLVFSSVYSVVRGALWGEKQFFAYSITELIEEAAMIVAGTLLIIRSTDMLDGARRAAMAITLSYVIALAAATIFYICGGGKLSSPKGQLKPLLASSAPITAMRTASAAINSLIAVILPARLIAAGFLSSDALSEYGMASGMAIPVLYAPSTAIGALALVLVPSLSESFYKKKHDELKRSIENALKTTCLIACFLIPFMFVLGEDAGEILFSSSESGKIISRCSFLVLPISLNMISSGMLNSLQQEKKTLLYFIISSAAMLGAIIFLPMLIGIYSLMAGMFLSLAISSALNLIAINKRCVKKPKYMGYAAKAFFGAVPAAIIGRLAYSLMNKLFSSLPAIILTSLIIAAVIVIAYMALNVISFSPLKKLFKTHPHKKSAFNPTPSS